MLSGKQKEYLDALIKFKKIKSFQNMTEDEKYYLMKILLRGPLSITKVNRYIKGTYKTKGEK